MNKDLVHAGFLFLIVFIVGISYTVYDRLPEMIATHWNALGVADGYSSKRFGLSIAPSILVALYLLYIAIPHLDPLKKNIAEFYGAYSLLFFTFGAYIAYIHVITIAANLSPYVNVGTLVVVGMGPLFIVIGHVLGKAKRNWFVGIRTPWTLSSDEVWAKTHALGKNLFVASGVCALAGVAAPKLAIWLVLVPVLASSVVLVVYSFILHKRLSQVNHE